MGPTAALGVDMTPEMLTRATQNAIAYRELATGQRGIPLGEIGSCRGDNSVDVVISNCVINLSPDKPAVCARSARG